jgi:AbiTii
VTDTAGLIEQIQSEALNSDGNLADALRKCIALGAQAGSEDLLDWATRELRGYFAEGDDPEPELPEYRIVAAPIVIDGMMRGAQFQRMQISPVELPQPMRGKVKEIVELRQGVGELEEMVHRSGEEGAEIRIGIPGGASAARVMASERGHFVERLYWSVSPTAVAGSIDQVRTRLVELSSRIKATTGGVGDPTPDAVQNAVSIVVTNSKRARVNVTAAQSSGAGSAAVTEMPPAEPPWWRRTKTIWGFVIGLATIIALVLAWLQWR